MRAAGISLRYPSKWTVLPTTKKRLGGIAKRLAKKNPKLATVLKSQSLEASAQQLQFQAVDLSDPTSFSSNLGVRSVSGSGPSSLDAFTLVMSAQADRIGANLRGTSTTHVKAKRAYRADTAMTVNLPDGTAAPAVESDLFLDRGCAWTVVTVATRDDAAGAQLIDDILGSVRLL
jgi:hypothetical protein